MKLGSWRAVAAFAALVIFSNLPANAAWRRAESPNFIVYGQESEARLRERILLLEDYDRLLRLITGIDTPPAPNKFTVYIVSGLDDLQVVQPVGSGVGGFYAATPGGIAAFVDSRAQTNSNEVLFHEYAHHFMWQYAPSAYPAWFVEGFAEYFSTARFRERTIEFGSYSQGRVYSIVGVPWLPMERVLFDTAAKLNREGSAQYYAQAWLLTHYSYSNSERQTQLRNYLNAIAGGTAPRDALESATGMDSEGVEEALRRYIRGGSIMYRRMQAPERPAPGVTVTELDRSADDLVLHQAALRLGVDEERQAEHLRRIRAVAARHPDQPFARRVRAQAELLFGDPAIADQLLEGLLAHNPGDAELLYLRGVRHLTAAQNGDDWEGEARQARTWFSRAHRADANHYQTLYRYAQSLRGADGFVSENTANILLLAHQLAPQVVEIRMSAAQMLISRNDISGAEALLRPIAASPHNSGLAEAAQQMLEQARSRAGAREPSAAAQTAASLPQSE